MNYATEVWGDTCDKHLSTLIKLQKKAVRIISHSDRREHTRPLFTKFNILRLEEIHILKIALTMFKVHHNETPLIFRNLFTRNLDLYSYETRQAYLFHVPKARTDYMQRAISVKGVYIWNRIAKRINYDCSTLTFKVGVKKYIIDNSSIVTYID